MFEDPGLHRLAGDQHKRRASSAAADADAHREVVTRLRATRVRHFRLAIAVHDVIAFVRLEARLVHVPNVIVVNTQLVSDLLESGIELLQCVRIGRACPHAIQRVLAPLGHLRVCFEPAGEPLLAREAVLALESDVAGSSNLGDLGEDLRFGRREAQETGRDHPLRERVLVRRR